MRVPVASVLLFAVTSLAGVASLIGTAATPAAAQSAQSQSPAVVRASLDSIMKAAYQPDDPGATAIVVHGGQVLLREGYGMANLELGVRMRPEHVFRIGSVTKQFTGVATLMLAEEGKLSLDDPITRFLPDFPTGGRTVTIQHLLGHTSGIRSYTDMESWESTWRTDYTLEQLIDRFRNEPFDFEPGARWAYNNSGYVLLGAIIEKASGTAYSEFLRARIFEPLGMSSTMYDETARVIPNRIPGYMPGEEGWINADYISMTHPHAAGALLSSVDDLARWDAAITSGKLLAADSWRQAFAPVALNDGRSTGYGAGWMMGRLGPHPTLEHGGGIHGFVTSMVRVPEQQLVVVVLTNASPPRTNPEEVALRLASRVLGVPAAAPAVALATEKLDEYIGVYRIDTVTTRTITRSGDRLFSQRSGGSRFEIYPIGEDRFAFRQSSSVITFVREGGRVTGMMLQPRLGIGDMADRVADVAVAASPSTVTLEPSVLERYVGVYQLAPNFSITITRDGSSLFGQATGQSRFTLAAESETRFRIEEVDATIDFHLDGPQASALTLHQGGRDMRASRKD